MQWHIDEFLKATIDADCRYFHIISGTVPVMQDRRHVKPMDYDRVMSREVYQVMDSFIEEGDKNRVLAGQDLLVGYPFSPRYSARIHLYRQRGTLALSGKLVETGIPDADALRIPDAVMQDWLSHRSGLILLAGTSDSGRTTTLNCMLKSIGESHSCNMVQFDDVLEGEFPEFESSLLSRRIYEKDVRDFDEAMRILKQSDTDVVSLGEINSISRLEAAIQLAARGQLVFGMLESADIENTLGKIFVMLGRGHQELRGLMASSLIGIYHQKFFLNLAGEPLFMRECMGVQSQIRRHLREGTLAPIIAWQKNSGRRDCIPYSRSFEELVADKKIEEGEVPPRYRI